MDKCVELVDLLTFWTVLSGSRAMSGTPASSIRENRFRIRFADLHTNTHTHTVRIMWGRTRTLTLSSV